MLKRVEVAQNYFDNQIVRKEDCCRLLDTSFRHEPKKFPGNALFQQGGGPSLTSLAVRALSAKFLTNTG